MNGASDSEGASRLQHRNLVSAWFNENSIPPPEITVPHCAEIKFMVAGSLLWPQQCFVVSFFRGVLGVASFYRFMAILGGWTVRRS